MRRVVIEWDPRAEWSFEGRTGVGCWVVYAEGRVTPYARALDAEKALEHAAQLMGAA